MSDALRWNLSGYETDGRGISGNGGANRTISGMTNEARNGAAQDPERTTVKPQRVAGAAYGLLAALAFGVLALVCVLSFRGKLGQGEVTGHLYGHNPPGKAGSWPRLFDTLSYFTDWSTLMVAVASTVTAWHLLRGVRPGLIARVLLLDSLVMITVTAIVYAVVLAPSDHVSGVSVITNPLQHIVVPTLTVVLWLVAGPRGWLTGKGSREVTVPRLLAGFLVIPAVWVVFSLVRGEVVHAYPYDFVDVATHGYGAVAQALLLVLAFGLALALMFWALDRMLNRIVRRRQRDTMDV